MNSHDAWKQIRGTTAETVLLNAHAAEGPCFRAAYGEGVSDERAAVTAAVRLRDLALAVNEHSMAGELDLTAEGHQLAEMILQSREDGPERWDAVQRALLRFVSKEAPSDAFEFIDSECGVVDGRRATKGEVEMAITFLKDSALMTALATFGHPGLRPQVTVNGMYAIHEPSIRGYVDRGFTSNSYDYSSTTTVTGGNVGAVVSGRSSATVHQAITSLQRTQVLDITERILTELPNDEDHSAIRAEIRLLQEEAANGAPRESLLAKAGSAALMAGATAAGQKIIGLLTELGQALGS